MLCSVAEFERKLINRRIYDGVKKAHEDGKYKGRQYGTEESIRREFVEKMKSGNYTISYLAKMAKVSRNTLDFLQNSKKVNDGLCNLLTNITFSQLNFYR